MNGCVACGAAGLLGKLPSQPEYLPLPSGSPAFSELDGWLTLATEWAAGRSGPEWPARFARGAIQAFAFHPPGAPPEQWLCGALSPSRDSAGRQFPLALAAPVSISRVLLQQPHLLPFVLEGFWASATTLVWEQLATPGEDAAKACSALQLEPVLDVEEAAELYGEWASDLTLRELWALIGPPLDGSDGSPTLRLLAETVAPYRGVEQPDTMLSLRLPLGMAAGAALCFWLNVSCLLLGWRSSAPSLFWSHDGQSGAALLHLGRPPKDTLAELWMPSGSSEQICDLTQAPAPELVAALRPLDPVVQALLADPRATVSQLLTLLRV